MPKLEVTLKPAEFAQARYALGLTQTELANVLESNLTSVIDWEKGHRDPPRRICQLLLAYLSGFRPPHWPDRMGSGPKVMPKMRATTPCVYLIGIGFVGPYRAFQLITTDALSLPDLVTCRAIVNAREHVKETGDVVHVYNRAAIVDIDLITAQNERRIICDQVQFMINRPKYDDEEIVKRGYSLKEVPVGKDLEKRLTSKPTNYRRKQALK